MQHDHHLFSRLDSIDRQLGELRADIGFVRSALGNLSSKVVRVSATTVLLMSAVGFMAWQVLA